MIVFLIPLKAPQVCDNWEHVQGLAFKTIHSILNQTSQNFHIILVCNEFPDFKHEKLTIIRENFPIPTNLEEGFTDKYYKLKRGMIEMYKFAPCYLMRIDADDLISNHLLKFVDKNEGPGWLIRRGYKYSPGKDYVIKSRNINDLCGSTNIIFVKKDEALESSDSPTENCHAINAGHHKIEALYQSLNRPLSDIPFPAVIYTMAHGNNLCAHELTYQSRKAKLIDFWNKRKISTKIKKEFGL